MKNILFIALAAALFSVPAIAQHYTANISASTLHWEGKKVTGTHNGYIKLKSGEFKVENNKIASGAFIIDMQSMTSEDLKGNENMMNKLMGHLKSDDFFGVEEYPVAKLMLKESTDFKNGKAKASAHLTIKNITHPITFDVERKAGSFHATIVVDRTLYNVRYGSGKFFDNLGDKTIYDDFTLTVNIVPN